MFAMLIGLPRWAKLAGIGAMIVIAGLIWLKFHTDAAVRADRAQAAAEAAKVKERADEASTGAVEASRNETERQNDEARKAAADSPDDPLKGALDKLREKR